MRNSSLWVGYWVLVFVKLTGIGNDGIGSVVMSLVEDYPQARPTSVGVDFKRLHKIGIGRNRCCGAQALQVIKQLLAPIIPGDCHLLLACVPAGCQFMQGSGYLCELGDESAIVSHEPKELLDLGDIGRGRAFSNSIYFAFVSCYSLGRDNVPQVCNSPVE